MELDKRTKTILEVLAVLVLLALIFFAYQAGKIFPKQEVPTEEDIIEDLDTSDLDFIEEITDQNTAPEVPEI